MKILMTGVTGFVGKPTLCKVCEIYGTQNVIALSSLNVPGIVTIYSNHYNFNKNYLIENGCEDVEILIHIGAYTPKDAKGADDFILTCGNITGTGCLLESVLPKLRKIIFISTLDVYSHTSKVVSEETQTVPATMYGWSKLYCEQMLRKHCEYNKLDYIILRLGHVYGEGEEKYRKVMPVMIQNAIEQKDLNIYGDGEAIRTFIYVDDVAEAIVKAIDVRGSEIINVVGNEQVSINQLACIIRDISNSKPRIIHTDTDVKNINYVFDNGKLMSMLLSTLTPLSIGLKKEYDYMLEKLTQ